jgi:hypothetical protein
VGYWPPICHEAPDVAIHFDSQIQEIFQISKSS